eukprot:TRINITY_DN110985_c0_g1_i1.p1 TRINITY_DN110985_c0_g1~~TRINITY_DN110985_c0_g1_i1.p1  ORF type:complete len:196 (-),score=48.32 TRINITY_DN110985_c0_g1_i1:253-771(-)
MATADAPAPPAGMTPGDVVWPLNLLFVPVLDFKVGDNNVQIAGIQLIAVIFLVGFFGYQKFVMMNEKRKCTARHILFSSEQAAKDAMKRLEKGEDFAKLASELSQCPSKKKGGSLGTFGPGQMVATFDVVCFDPDNKVGEVLGPIQTGFGYHLILIESREGVESEEQERKNK